MKVISRYILYILLSGVIFAQHSGQIPIKGRVSYISVTNIYVKFENTQGIDKGDTLWVQTYGKYIPVMKVNYMSSKSVAGEQIGNKELKINDELTAFIIIEHEKTVPLEDENQIIVSGENELIKTYNKKFSSAKNRSSEINGKISIQSYSNISNQNKQYNYQRWRYTFRLNAKNIGGSGLSYSHYINFAYRADEWSEINSDFTRALRIYDLALRYDFSEYSTIWIGRHINRNVSSISSIDGLQFETSLAVFTVGLIAGSRPDFRDMGLNAKLFQYGVYLSRTDSVRNGLFKNTVGYFEQTNDFKTDRRFIYFQHSNSIIKNTSIFISSEIDLFKKEFGKSKNEISLTSLFVSANIRPSSYVNFYFSYDARKNVIYYETFKSFADSVFDNETRQGFRSRVTVRPVKNLYLGINYGYRFRKGDPKPSSNYGGYITFSLIPVIKSGITVRISKLFGTYSEGLTWGIRLYKNLDWGMGFSLNYRNTRYSFSQKIQAVTQQSFSLYLNTSIVKPIYINIGYEGVFQSVRTSGRILFNLSYGF